MAKLLAGIDWKWWLTEVPVRVDWWPSADHFWYVHVCRLNLVLLATAGMLVVLIFFLNCLRRSGIEIIWRG